MKTLKNIGIFFLVMVVAGILMLIFIPKYKAYKENRQKAKTEERSPSTSKKPAEKLVFMEAGDVGPGMPWITSKVNYRFRFEGNGHSFYLEFTSKEGGWTKPTLIHADDGTIKIDMPKDAKAGPVRVTVGPDEKEVFSVSLNKKAR